ncbi:MAG TPA: RIP metalloprotease RseP [Thermoanaerobaculia bacterium]|jgi:regulator of sigma E protease
MNIPTNVLALVFVLSFLIVFHEGGHFAVAKFFKFPVEIFSLGFGKRLFGWKRRETDYRVSLIPLGGYVKVVGLGPDESDIVAGEHAAPAQPGTRLQRLLILFAGPGVNLVFAVLLTMGAFMIGIELPRYFEERPVVTFVDPGSPAESAGVKPNDLITSLFGKPVTTWREVELQTGLGSRQKIPIEVLRDGQTVTLTLQPEPKTEEQKKYDVGFTGLHAAVPVYVGSVLAGSPSAKAGLKVDDRIVSVGGHEVSCFSAVVWRIAQEAQDFKEKGARPIDIGVEREGARLTIPVTPRAEGAAWRIGFGAKFLDTVRRSLPVGAAFESSVRELRDQVRATGTILGRLFAFKGSFRQLSGPIDIAKFSGEAARAGVAPLLSLMGVLSLQLGLLNLLPIPLLDGGQIFVTLLEAAARRDFSIKVKERLLQAGFAFLVLIMVTVLYFDVIKNVSF